MADPTIVDYGPTGTGNDPDTDVFFEIDDDVQVLANTLEMDLFEPGSVVAIPVLSAGVWLGFGYDGTIIQSGNGWKATLDTHELFRVGVWSVRASGEDALGGKAEQIFQFTVNADAPALSEQDPADESVTTTLDTIHFRITDGWGIDATSIVFKAIGPRLEERLIYDGSILGGGWQTGYDGRVAVVSSGGEIISISFDVDTFPAFPSGERWTFSLDADNVVGRSL